MQKLIVFFLLFFSLSTQAQEFIIKGKIIDLENRGIQNASVSLINENGDYLEYDFTDENGNYSIAFQNPKSLTITIEISCLGYGKISKIVSNSSQSENFILEKKAQILQEVIIESSKKVRVEQDTTTIKVASFGNKTEQTIEDVLKKIPGIVVLKDGTIKAHGVSIDKLLVEGEDMFDKNYKLLSKNLDAKVLESIQIIDNFEDNPILKKLNKSEKVALNLKLVKGKKNIWFGNVTLGSGVVSENRWKESLNLGLIRKKIKLFYLADYNNLGEKATDIVATDIHESNIFSEDRLEFKAKSLFQINNNEVALFSKTQSVFNNAFLNTLSFATKRKDNLSLRGVVYLAQDRQNQNSFSETRYNLEDNPISFTVNNFYNNRKTVASTEIELKYYPNDKNYVTNLFIYKINPNVTNSDLFFNLDEINQLLKNKNYTFYNHFNHTLQLSENKILNSYVYFGNDEIRENVNVLSPLLNDFLNVSARDVIRQRAHNNLFYIGDKTKLLTKFSNIDVTNSVQFEFSKEEFNNSFVVNTHSFPNYENFSNLKQLKFLFDNAIRYNFSKKIDFTALVSLQYINFESNNVTSSIFLVNPTLSLNIKKTGFGNFKLSYSENNTLPEINQLTTNFQLIDYRSFAKGTRYENPLKNTVATLNYSIYLDEKRFSVNSALSYIKSKSILNTESIITNDFNFSNLRQTLGGDNYNFSFSFVNYVRKLKLASKIENIQNWNSSPVNVNATEFTNSENYSNKIKYSVTSYFKKAINFDSGFSYNYTQSVFENIKTTNVTKDIFLDVNYTISKTILAECNSAIYFINQQNYSFNNIIINYNPVESKFSYRLVFNNILNENKFTLITLNNFTFYQSTVELVPRYLLCAVKYRF
ncbi:CarboxypepD_reg-like domain-containing protein [Flavobacterium segetis]|uniref:CarboxypepD_reg-like domain-containing protein n=1 Tax=Flavobacterium segetis TaxID=271157 RepID=A0A1M5FDW9_9FLAO|nr:TonB-dependent receptor [Flavobacterium segetis]SHF89750.1 CarboxypepD_reg-like domain-containing protein [Flavobacterium segetis]